MKDIRREYESAPFDESMLSDDPFDLLQNWINKAIKSDIALPNAMTLGTVDEEGLPATRTVLLKGIHNGGLEFFTNYDSLKGQHLAKNPKAALTIFWKEFNRQINIRGDVKKLSRKQSENYFASRPLGSQISAAISPQSQVVTKEQLEKDWAKLEGTQDVIEAPKSWGGYVLEPCSIEFWQGRPNRLHDRFLYQRRNKLWRVERLAP